MPIRLTCPEGHRISVGPDKGGKKVRCPKCQAVVPVPANDESASAPVDEETPSPKKKRKRRRVNPPATGRHPMWQVIGGLRLYTVKLALYPLAQGVTLLPFLAQMGGKAAQGLANLGFLILIISSLLGIVAMARCLFATRQSYPKTLLIVGIAFDVVSVLCCLLVRAFPGGPIIPLLGGSVAALVALAMFLFYMRWLATLLEGRNSGSRSDALHLIVFGILLYLSPAFIFLASLLLYFVLTGGTGPDDVSLSFVALVSYGLLVGWLALCIRYLLSTLTLLNHLKGVIEKRMP